MDGCSYMCADCFQAFDSINVFNKHGCQINIEYSGKQQELPVSLQKGQAFIISSAQKPQSASAASFKDSSNTFHVKSHDISESHLETSQHHGDEVGSTSDLGEGRYDEDDPREKIVVKKRKYQVMDDSYRLNRTMRDKDFKLARSNFYSFKDTLGDWDERATQLLIQLIQKYPQTYFLLNMKNERRMIHWEKLHKEMEAAGYNFTILQLRMRWREVLQKYRWTVNYNDFHEIKKRCEYFDEMNELCGDWDKAATQALLRQMHRVKQDNQGKKIVRIGYSGWEKITENLNMEGHKYTIHMVEGRWRNLVTLYKTMIDHNSIPNVEPQVVAYKEDLEELVKYVPQRRNNYEKKVGRSVKMERFPSNGCRILLQAYKDCMSRFVDPKIDNRILWDEITKRLEDEGLCFTTFKLKETFTGMIKGFEKCQYHNSLPGAIRRDVPYYRELAEVYGVYGRWPHIQTSRTMEMRTKRKYRLRLQVSQQLWRLEESRTLLQVYPDVLESHVNQCLSHQPSDLWLQVAKVYSATGYPKRDVPEIAVHIGLLRQGYAQNNKFPFNEEMRKVKETEEAVCYSPDVSKYTGEVEITYWSHEAVNLLLDLYMKHQSAAASSHASRNEVFVKINESMKNIGYKYTKEEVCDQFKFLLTQYNTRKLKPWMLPPVGRQTHNPVGAPYLEKLQKVIQLRREMSLSWTTGVKPLTPQAQKILLRVACQKAEELLIKLATEREKKILLGQIVDGIIVHIRTHQLIDPVPRTRQVRLHIAEAMKNSDKGTESKDVACLHKLFKDCNILDLMCNISLEPTSYDYRMKSKRKKMIDGAQNGTRMEAEKLWVPGSSLEIKEDSASSVKVEWMSEEEHSHVLKCQELDEVLEYLTFALCHFCKAGQDHNVKNICRGMYTKPESSKDILSSTETGTGTFPNVKMLDSIDENSVRHDDDGLSYSLNSQVLAAEKINEENDSEISLPFSRSRCSSSMCKDGTSDIYGKVFGKIQSGLPINSIRQNNNILCTISCDSDFKLMLLLPDELTPHVESVLVNNENLPGKDCKQRDEKNMCQDHLSNVKTSEPKDSPKQDNFKNKQSDSMLLNDEPILETKIIQTRSGRKTRFTFFSQTLNDDDDGKDFEGSELHNVDLVSPTKKFKVDSEAHNSAPSIRKKGRPRKVSHENLALDCAVTKNDIAVIQSHHAQHSLLIPQKNSNLNSKMRSSLKDPVLSFIKNHHIIKTTQENELVKIMKEHQQEHTNILEKICSILEDLDHHH